MQKYNAISGRCESIYLSSSFEHYFVKLSLVIDTFCEQYCQNGTCTNNQTSYNCTCPPGTSLDYALNCARKYTCLIEIGLKSCWILACIKGLAGPNCGLICDCDFGTCNVNATSEANKCNCSTGYTGLRCNENINFCATGK